ncbi:MAG: hypothetical protein A2X18_07580 [Bacteroidetes bacterium GWF2_40_14]|nr:MAG: hypothetical protein A2X18_07580 [Bacteroidetes bacterium GWF2_40_14]
MAWWKLYGFPYDPRLWIAFFVHDLGYFGKPNMDGPEGETHVIFGAMVMLKLFDKKRENGTPDDLTWYEFSLLHSRFYAKKLKKKPSKLCYADKLAICLEPYWLYLPRVNATGEIKEYMQAAKAEDGKYKKMEISVKNQKAWFYDVCNYLNAWVYEHYNGKEDTWTPSRNAMNITNETKEL